MVLTTRYRWLGVVTLSGLLLSCSIPWATENSSATGSQVPVFNKVLISSVKLPDETYPRVIRERLNWTTAGQPVVQAAAVSQPVAAQASETTAVAADTKAAAKTETKQETKIAAESSPKPVQTASAVNTQVARGDTDISGLIENALSLQGIPYVFGGTAAKVLIVPDLHNMFLPVPKYLCREPLLNNIAGEPQLAVIKYSRGTWYFLPPINQVLLMLGYISAEVNLSMLQLTG